MAAITREPTHELGHDGARLRLHPVGSGLGVPVQLTDRLERDLRRAWEATAKAEADVLAWLHRTDQDDPRISVGEFCDVRSLR